MWFSGSSSIAFGVESSRVNRIAHSISRARRARTDLGVRADRTVIILAREQAIAFLFLGRRRHRLNRTRRTESAARERAVNGYTHKPNKIFEQVASCSMAL